MAGKITGKSQNGQQIPDMTESQAREHIEREGQGEEVSDERRRCHVTMAVWIVAVGVLLVLLVATRSLHWMIGWFFGRPW